MKFKKKKKIRGNYTTTFKPKWKHKVTWTSNKWNYH